MRLTIPDRGGATRAMAFAGYSWWLALGVGEESWGTAPPSIDNDVQGLTQVIGYLRAREVHYVVPSDQDNAQLVTKGGTYWSISEQPTRYIYSHFRLDFGKAGDAVLREIALFLGAETGPDVLPGQNYVPIEQMTDIGHLYGLDRFAPVYLNESKRPTFSTVMSF